MLDLGDFFFALLTFPIVEVYSRNFPATIVGIHCATTSKSLFTSFSITTNWKIDCSTDCRAIGLAKGKDQEESYWRDFPLKWKTVLFLSILITSHLPRRQINNVRILSFIFIITLFCDQSINPEWMNIKARRPLLYNKLPGRLPSFPHIKVLLSHQHVFAYFSVSTHSW